jgi:putative sigma-54 modulation protein
VPTGFGFVRRDAKISHRPAGEQCRSKRKERTRMIVTVSSRHIDVTPPLKEYAEHKASKLTKYFDRISEIEVVIEHANDAASGAKVEMIVSAEQNHRFIAHHTDGDAYACIDAVVDKLERQLSDHKKKIRNRKHPEG